MRRQQIKVRAGKQQGTGKRCYMIGVPWQIAEVLSPDLEYEAEMTNDGILFRPVHDTPVEPPSWAEGDPDVPTCRDALEQALGTLERAIPDCRCNSLAPECPKCIARLALGPLTTASRPKERPDA